MIKIPNSKLNGNVILMPYSVEEPFTERSGGVSTDRTISGHDTPSMPSAITEIFKSLYNTEWNHCYTEMTKRYTDDHAIEILRRWLKVSLVKERPYTSTTTVC